MNNRKLIKTLANDLTPGTHLLSPFERSLRFGFFLLFSFILLVALISGYRESLSEELLYSRVLLEVFLALLSFSCLLLASFKSVIPGEKFTVYLFLGFSFLSLYLATIFFNFTYPYEHTFIHAHNHQCAQHLYLFSTIAQCMLLYFLNKGVAIFSFKTSLLSSLSVSSLSLMLMNFTCMFDYSHILKHHVFSFLSISLILTVLSSFFFKAKNYKG